MRLHNLIKSGGRKDRKRVGRGEGSGRGKTSGRGHKGQRSRSGSSLRPGFESGHVPLYRKLPKRGFSNFKFRTEYSIINVGDLDRLEAGSIDRDVLVRFGLARSSSKLIKILGEGEVTKAFTVQADKFSASAKEKIEKAGGTVVVNEPAAADSSEAPAE
ncbi:50S ribosomal protein L15 [Puniceicoccales bacterium CK1056]|uniref:Large ribosomal subunit protein uL15 n=1 Tax=Oceanipulchritudo coccoides TaxID=2706888 RepID=A0A6B2M103_9BACT|nr:50S ribosomal protein L15 [Oceanipulchritudo coccoides]NDV62661.1 50S ribosomal protein L15 [Oceanipulchritudo coccoides]